MQDGLHTRLNVNAHERQSIERVITALEEANLTYLSLVKESESFGVFNSKNQNSAEEKLREAAEVIIKLPDSIDLSGFPEEIRGETSSFLRNLSSNASLAIQEHVIWASALLIDLISNEKNLLEQCIDNLRSKIS